MDEDIPATIFVRLDRRAALSTTLGGLVATFPSLCEIASNRSKNGEKGHATDWWILSDN